MNYEDYDGLGLAELIKRRETSAVEVVDAAIAKIEELNPTINAVILKQFERARELAQKPLSDGIFAGVPFLFKDLGASEIGIPETLGSRFCQNYRPSFQNELVKRYYDAGFIPLGRTNTPELGLLPTTEPEFYGPTRNPWNLEHIVGGSSGGSAAAVASFMVPLAHANDGGGSIRIPASCCGLFGLKPTEGRSPTAPNARMWQGMVVDHVVTRSVRDSAAALDVICARDKGAAIQTVPPAHSFLSTLSKPLNRLKIGFAENAHFGATLHPDCRDATLDAAKLCESLGHRVEATKFNIDDSEIAEAFLVILAGETGCTILELSKLIQKPNVRDLEALTHVLSLGGRYYTATEYSHAVKILDRARRRVCKTFENFDVVLTPTLALPPPKIGELTLSRTEIAQLNILRRFPNKSLIRKVFSQIPKTAFSFTPYTFLFNITGQPAMSVPLYSNGHGLPIGVQFIAEHQREDLLLQLAAELEKARPFTRLPSKHE